MTFQPITKREARGNSPAMSLGELRALADWGERVLSDAASDGSRQGTLTDDMILAAYKETREPWGGVTLDLASGHVLSLASGYAVSTGAVAGRMPPERRLCIFAEAILDAARRVPVGQYLGVFHDADESRYDIDSVYLTDSLDEAIAVGVARHATGGIYDFATGDGVWVPHLSEA